MSAKYAVLGLLLERRGYGYQLVQRLTERLGPAWQLTPSSVYAALDLLEGEGLARPALPAAGATGGNRAAHGRRRAVYEATAAGREAFSSWVTRPSRRQEPIRRELHLKVALARRADVPGLLAALDHEELLVRTLSSECIEGIATCEGAKPSAGRRTAEVLVRAGAVARLNGELRWIDAARTGLEALAAGRDAPGGKLLHEL